MRKIIWRSVIVVGVLWCAWWVVWELMGLERYVEVSRSSQKASQNNQIVVAQYAFSPGGCRFILPLDRHASTQSIITSCEKNFMNQYVPEETYGQTWALENSSTGKMIRFDNDSLQEVGIEAGTVLRVLRLEKGEPN